MTAASVRVALVALRAYKLCISPYFMGSCRFLPSCADYAAEAIGHYGLIRGGWLAAQRLARCHPLCHAGHDPVPLPQHPEQSSSGARAAARASSPAVKAGLNTCATK